MARILSIDYGKKRTGIAVTDPLQIIPNGLATVATSELLPFLKSYMDKESVERVVIGEPKRLNGQPDDNSARVRQFTARFKEAFPLVPIECYDERFTSVLAHKTIIDSGIGKKARRNKSLVDEISATIILQDYMQYMKGR